MKRKWNVILGTMLLVVACLFVSACASTDDADKQKDKANTEQGVTEDNKEDGTSMPDIEEHDDDYNWEEEESDGALIEDPDEGVIIEEDVLE